MGFFEEDSSKSDGTSGIGRVVISAIASKDSTKLYPSSWGPANFTQLGKVIKLENAHLDSIIGSDLPADVNLPSASYQLGGGGFASGNSFVFSYPLGGAEKYKFEKIIQFNPQGDAAKINDSPVPWMGIGLRGAHGNVADTSKNRAAILITGIGGGIQIYRP